MRMAYVNGEFVPLAEARVSVLDRGFLFADGVYEVVPVLEGRLVDSGAHLARLARSLGEIGLECPVPLAELPALLAELVRRDGVAEGLVYLQVTRGPAEREFGFPADAQPSLVMFTQARSVLANPKARTGVDVITIPDIRWARRDIKSVGLLAQVLAKQAAADAGAGDAWMVEDGLITEGSSSNAFIVTVDGTVVTRRADRTILSGVTRKAVLALAAEHGLSVEERGFSVEEAKGAAEAFLTSATAFVLPVVSIDGSKISQGVPGPLTRRLRDLYIEFVRAEM